MRSYAPQTSGAFLGRCHAFGLAFPAPVSSRATAAASATAYCRSRYRRGAAGPRRFGPGLPPTGRMLNTRRIACVTSLTLAAVTVALRGIPCASVSIWCLLPGLPRSVGFGPVSSPPSGAM